MSFFSNLFGKGKKGKPEIQITKLPTASDQKPQEETEGTEVRMLFKESVTPIEKDEKQWEAKEIPVWNPGDVILDRYKIEDVITSGGMGLVYIANHQNWKVKVAIKSPTEEILQDKDFFSRVQKEAEAWTELGLHPNIAYCYFVRNIEKVPHIFVEYVDGGNLRQWIEEGRCADLKTGLDLAIQFCHGMAHAHSKGMIHRDIKPANILMTKDGTLKVTDFGIAKVEGDEVKPSIPTLEKGGKGGFSDDSNTVGFIGTKGYASPEQWEDAHNVGPESDIFSFGLCLWEMLCGMKPYTIAIEKVDIPNPRKLRTDLPESIHKLLEQLVAFEREERQKLEGFEGLRERFKSIYQELFNGLSPHSALEKVDLQAGGLNNRAVSYLELGKHDEARRCFEEAVTADNIHPQAVFNLALMQWRASEIDDLEAVRRINNCMNNPTCDKAKIAELLAYIHAERSDGEDAKKALCEYDGRFDELLGGRNIGGMGLTRTFEGHDGDVNAVVLSADSRYALSGGEDKTLKLWDVATGQCLRTLEDIGDEVVAVSLSADGGYGLSKNANNTARLWDLRTGKCLSTFGDNSDKVLDASLSGDGRFALLGGSCSLNLYEVKTGRCLRTFQNYGAFNSVSFSEDGRYAVSGSDDRKLKLWEVETGKCLRSFEGHRDRITAISLSVDCRYVLSGSWDETLRLWEMVTGKCLRTFVSADKFISKVGLSRDGRYAFSRGFFEIKPGCVPICKLWDVVTARCMRTFENHAGIITSIIFNADRRYTLSLSRRIDHTWKLRELGDAYFSELQLAGFSGYSKIKADEDELYMAIREAEDLIKDGKYTSSFSKIFVAWQKNGFRENNDVTRVYDKLSSKAKGITFSFGYCKNTFGGHSESVTSVCFSPDGRYAMSGSGDTTLKLWDVETGKCLRTFEGHSGYIFSVSLSGRCVLSGSMDETLKLWDVETGRCLRTLEGHRDWVKSVVLSLDSKYALSGSNDKTMKLWDVQAEICLRTFEGHENHISSVSLCADGRYALSGSYDMTMKLWDVQTGKCLRTFVNYIKSASFDTQGSVVSNSLSSDGRYAISGSHGSEGVKLWEIKSGKCLCKFGSHSESVDLSSDNRYALVGGLKNVSLWEVDPEKYIENTTEGAHPPLLKEEEEWEGGLYSSKDLSQYMSNKMKMMKQQDKKSLYTFDGHNGKINSVVFRADKKYALSGSDDKTIKLWRLIWDLKFEE